MTDGSDKDGSRVHMHISKEKKYMHFLINFLRQGKRKWPITINSNRCLYDILEVFLERT